MDRMIPDHEVRFKKALGLLAITFMRDPKKELDDARVLRYWKQLEEYDIDVVEQACLALEGKLRKFPLPVDIREACDAIHKKRERSSTARPNPRPPGAQPWCDQGCDDTGWLEVVAPLCELRDVPLDDAMARQQYRAVRRCSCWAINPVRRWRAEQNSAGVIRREEKAESYDPQRRGELVRFRRPG